MIGPLLRLSLWLLGGHVLLAALFWGLLNIPESNVAMLGLSALVALTLLAGEAAIAAGAVLLAQPGGGWLPGGRMLVRALPRALAALIGYAAIRYALAWLGARYGARTGEIDAWLIATLDWTRTTALHTAVDWALWGVGHVLAAAAALALLLSVVPASGDARPWRRAFGLRRLATIAAILLVGVWLPWQVVGWRPDGLPDTVVQPVFAATKLLLVLAIAHVSLALLLLRLTRPAPGIAPAG